MRNLHCITDFSHTPFLSTHTLFPHSCRADSLSLHRTPSTSLPTAHTHSTAYTLTPPLPTPGPSASAQVALTRYPATGYHSGLHRGLTMSLLYALIRCAPRRSVCHIVTESGPRVGSMHNSPGLHTLRGQPIRLPLRSVVWPHLFRSCISPCREVLRPVRSCRHRLRHRRLHTALRSRLCLLPCRAPLTHSPSHYRPLRGRAVAKREPTPPYGRLWLAHWPQYRVSKILVAQFCPSQRWRTPAPLHIPHGSEWSAALAP